MIPWFYMPFFEPICNTIEIDVTRKYQAASCAALISIIAYGAV